MTLSGNVIEDEPSGTVYGYSNRLATLTVAGSLKGAARVTTKMTPAGTTHFIHDLAGNVIAETAGGGATGATGSPSAARLRHDA